MADFLIMLIALIGNSFLGLFTLFKNPKSATNRLFFLFSLSIAVYITFNYLATNNENVFIWVRGVMTVAVFINILFFLFAKTFPYSSLKINKFTLLNSLVFTMLMFPLIFSNLIFKSVNKTSSGYETIPGLGMPLFLLHTLIFLGAGFIILIKKYKNSFSIERTQIKLLLLGAVTMFCLIIVANLLLVVLFNITIFVGLLPLYTLIFVGFVSYAIVKHRFLDIRLIVARSVTYFLLVTILAFFYTFLLLILSTYITGMAIKPTNLIPSVALTFLISWSFRPLNKFLSKYTDKIFFKDKYDSNALLHQMSKLLSSTLDLHELSEKVFRVLFHELKIMSGAVILIKNHHYKRWTYGFRFNVDSLKDSEIHHLIEVLEKRINKEHIIVFDELPESTEKKIMRDHNISIIRPLIVKREILGIFLFGPKASGDIYPSEDIEMIKILSPEIAIAIRNSMSFDEIKRFNITLEEEVQKATEKLQNANHRLKELDLLKDEFVSLASHELRTPMTAIKSYLWMALNKPPAPLHPEMKSYLDISYKSTERLIHLVNDMLTVSRIERNKVELKLAQINLFELVKQVYDELKITADEKKIKFEINNKTADLLIEADKDRIREIVQNLVGNALKFTPVSGNISITLTQEGEICHIAVADTGSGIPKEEMSKLFTKFGRIDYSYTQHANSPGTGLGLYISKQIATLHHGDIGVQSVVGKGSIFTLILPVKQPKEATHGTEHK